MEDHVEQSATTSDEVAKVGLLRNVPIAETSQNAVLVAPVVVVQVINEVGEVFATDGVAGIVHGELLQVREAPAFVDTAPGVVAAVVEDRPSLDEALLDLLAGDGTPDCAIQ